ncbi:hypothetical protein Tco_1060785 [Tanacetum coccineum]
MSAEPWGRGVGGLEAVLGERGTWACYVTWKLSIRDLLEVLVGAKRRMAVGASEVSRESANKTASPKKPNCLSQIIVSVITSNNKKSSEQNRMKVEQQSNNKDNDGINDTDEGEPVVEATLESEFSQERLFEVCCLLQRELLELSVRGTTVLNTAAHTIRLGGRAGRYLSCWDASVIRDSRETKLIRLAPSDEISLAQIPGGSCGAGDTFSWQSR